MKNFFKLLLAVFLCSLVNTAYSLPDSVATTVTNFTLIGNGTHFSFDIYTLRISSNPVPMGSSTYVLRYDAGTLTGPVLSNVNPKYTVGSVTNSYAMPQSAAYFNNSKIALQINYVGGSGDVITDDPGTTGFGERIATVTMNILQQVNITMTWDLVDSYVVGTNPLVLIGNGFFGQYNGPLPVELASFTSIVNRNNVRLEWSTTSETNNNGFDVERKANNSEWTKIGFVNGNGTINENKVYTFTDNNLLTGSYNYRLKQVDFNGNFEYFELDNSVEVGVPARFELSQNYPNPFNPSTKINFSLPEDSRVSLSVFDISGRLLSTILNNEHKTANYYTVEFNGNNLSSGTYFYTIRTDKFTETKKMLLLK